MPKQWTERDYLEAVNIVDDVDDDGVKQALTARIRQYEQGRGLASPTGVAAYEAAAGVRQPTDEELEAETKVPDVIPEMPQYKRPARTAEGLKSTFVHRAWYEPSIDEFRREMEPIIGVGEAEGIDEQHPLFERYADMKWSQAHDAAKKEGKALLRARDIDESSLSGKIEKLGADVAEYAVPALRGVEEGMTGGLLSSGVAKLEELSGLDPNASEDLERERNQGGPGIRALGTIGGMLTPGGLAARASSGAAKLVAPQLGKLVTRGGGLASRVAARGGTAAASGAAGLVTQGGAEDIATGIDQGVNPFSLDFLARRGKDAVTGLVAGPIAEGIGTGASRLGNIGANARAKTEVERATAKYGAARRMQSLTRRAKQGDKVAQELLSAIKATGGNIAPSNLSPQIIGALASTALGSPFGRITLLSQLARKVPIAGEGFFKAAAKELQAAQLTPDVVKAIKENAIVRGGDVMKPSRGGGSALGIPFTEGASPNPTTLTPEEAESFIREIYDEEKAARDAAEDESGDAGPTGMRDMEGDTVPAGFFSDLHEGVTGLSRLQAKLFRKAPPRPPAANYKQDPEFMALLAKIPSVTPDPDEARDQMAGYVQNYPVWRTATNEARAAGEEEPDFSKAFVQRFNAKGFWRTPKGDELAGELGTYSDRREPANPQMGRESAASRNSITRDDQDALDEGFEHERSALPTTADRAAFDKKLGGNADTEKIVKTMAARMRVGVSAPPPKIVYEALKEIGYNVPLADVKRMLRSYSEVEI